MTLSPQDRADGRRLEQAATKEPWRASYDEDDASHHIEMGSYLESPGNYESHHLIEYNHGLYPNDGDGDGDVEQFDEAEANAEFIVWLRNHASALLAADEDRERLQTQYANAKKVLIHTIGKLDAAEAALARERQAHATTRDENEMRWRPIATAPPGLADGKWTYVLFKGYSKGRSFPGYVVVSGWMGKTHDGKLEPVHNYSYKLVITEWMPMPLDAALASPSSPEQEQKS